MALEKLTDPSHDADIAISENLEMIGEIGKLLVTVGLCLTVVGLVLWLVGDKLGDLSWFGRLPGDIRIEQEGFSFYMPIMTMLLLSFGLSAVMWLVQLLKR